ncbi:DUF4169 family protein [Tritonibacter horizontis]|uniref:Uncharacterized protein n=1 Tax=Tritonibacter horizontis TaxID=1768241 RepID=A0A132BSK2_9RHOB|nr:DUF4169 family protein [Tritonibacter horizontis]KUP91351.1 hypothetical protein TRIHO_37970 [Tritonibacter horizontis]
MSDVVNLNRFRKQKARTEQKARANENAVKFGRSKAVKALDQTEATMQHKHLDRHRIDDKTPE